MNLRKITSMTLFLSSIVLLFNSVVLYVVPEGRVAYWADWKFLGLTKTQWGEQHTVIGVLFVIAGIIHIIYNWRPIVTYMKNSARKLTILTPSFVIGLALTLAFVIGTYLEVPPMKTIVFISSSFKDRASMIYGEPPYGHAESSSLKVFTTKERIDLTQSRQLLADAGIKVTSDQQTIKDIALSAGVSPQKIYELILPAKMREEGEKSLSPGTSEGSGMGKRTLEDICQTYGLQQDRILQELSRRGISASPEKTLRQIADANKSNPRRIFETIAEIAEEMQKQP